MSTCGCIPSFGSQPLLGRSFVNRCRFFCPRAGKGSLRALPKYEKLPMSQMLMRAVKSVRGAVFSKVVRLVEPCLGQKQKTSSRINTPAKPTAALVEEALHDQSISTTPAIRLTRVEVFRMKEALNTSTPVEEASEETASPVVQPSFILNTSTPVKAPTVGPAGSSHVGPFCVVLPCPSSSIRTEGVQCTTLQPAFGFILGMDSKPSPDGKPKETTATDLVVSNGAANTSSVPGTTSFPSSLSSSSSSSGALNCYLGPPMDLKMMMSSPLGRGSYGVVYPGSLGTQQVAVKCMPLTFKTAFDCEVRIMMNLPKHPNLLSYMEAYQSGDQLMMVMELATGGNLRQWMSEPHTYKECLTVCLNMFNAIQVMHEKRIVHRDLKSENIMMTDDGTVKVADFGSAMSGTGYWGQEGCTWLYMAPEVCSGQATQGPAADIWSLGVIFTELLCCTSSYYDYQAGETDEARKSEFVSDLGAGNIEPWIWQYEEDDLELPNMPLSVSNIIKRVLGICLHYDETFRFMAATDDDAGVVQLLNAAIQMVGPDATSSEAVDYQSPACDFVYNKESCEFKPHLNTPDEPVMDLHNQYELLNYNAQDLALFAELGILI